MQHSYDSYNTLDTWMNIKNFPNPFPLFKTFVLFLKKQKGLVCEALAVLDAGGQHQNKRKWFCKLRKRKIKKKNGYDTTFWILEGNSKSQRQANDHTRLYTGWAATVNNPGAETHQHWNSQQRNKLSFLFYKDTHSKKKTLYCREWSGKSSNSI